MSQLYYFIAQLPSFSSSADSSKPSITSEYFLDLCRRFLSPKAVKIAENLSLEPPKADVKTTSAFLNQWYDRERKLRFALAQIRALKMKKEVKDIPATTEGDIVQAARTACGMDSPLKAEQFLNEYRLSVLDKIAPLDQFSEDAVYNYGLRLMLSERIHKFNKEEGMASYRKLYDEILGESK